MHSHLRLQDPGFLLILEQINCGDFVWHDTMWYSEYFQTYYMTFFNVTFLLFGQDLQ